MAKTIVIELREKPLDKDYEHFIAAYLQAGRYYVERSILDRDIEEVLELDIVITDFNIDYPDPVLIEIKSGGWGFGDLFKIAGWLQYTIFETGALIVKQDKGRNMDFYIDKATNQIGVKLIHNKDYNSTPRDLADFINPESIDLRDVEVFRFAYWIENNLLRYLKQQKKSDGNEDFECFRALEDYYFKISSGIFTAKNLLDRIDLLYSAFKQYPLITAKCTHELSGGMFSENVSTVDYNYFKEAYYQKRLNIVQVSTFIEHQARLTILKNCVEYLVCSEQEENAKTTSKQTGFRRFFRSFSKLDFLPETFLEALESLKDHSHYYLYPVFWQWFLYAFGGFVLLDQKEREYKLFSEKTGMPIDQIDNALSVYDLLFPKGDSWLRVVPNTNILNVDLFSAPFMGNGVNYRKDYYTEDKRLESLMPLVTGNHSYNDMISWNNLAVDVLNRDYKPLKAKKAVSTKTKSA